MTVLYYLVVSYKLLGSIWFSNCPSCISGVKRQRSLSSIQNRMCVCVCVMMMMCGKFIKKISPILVLAFDMYNFKSRDLYKCFSFLKKRLSSRLKVSWSCDILTLWHDKLKRKAHLSHQTLQQSWNQLSRLFLPQDIYDVDDTQQKKEI